MTTTDALRNAALANADSTTPGVMLEVGDRLLWVYPCDGTVYWFLDGKTVSEEQAEAFLRGNDVDPRRIVDAGG
jgi:hypothetical protein